jgi:peptidoglycan hydrolase-like protein with peptidoglycan-binding domain
MVLRQGDRGDAVKALQRGLNKFGEMLLIDGDFGAGTRDAVAGARVTLGLPGQPEADDDLQRAVEQAPDPFPQLTAAGGTFIAREEVSDVATYRKKFQFPCLPPAPSGITIGIGYDCRFVTRAELETDWADLLPPEAIAQLAPAVGKIGSADLRDQIGPVVIPLGAAMRVFATRSVPKYLEQTRSIYPQVAAGTLNAAQRTALVSLVYNRGTALTGERRSEMLAIRDLLASNRLDEVAGQFESMTRLWSAADAPGLIRRRRAEATLWRSGFASLQLD